MLPTILEEPITGIINEPFSIILIMVVVICVLIKKIYDKD